MNIDAKTGEIADIDECRVRPGIRSICPPNEQCVNTDGSYRCLSRVICPAGYETGINGSRCAGGYCNHSKRCHLIVSI